MQFLKEIFEKNNLKKRACTFSQLAKRVKCSLFPFLSAKKQAEIQRNIDDLKREVDKRDLDIRILQKNLKEAENVLVSI